MKLLSLITAIGLGLVVSVAAQTTTDEQQQQPPTRNGKNTQAAQQNTDQPAGPAMGHSEREKMKDTSQPAKMKSGGTANTSTGKTTTVNKEEFKSRHSEVFSLGRHPREFFVQRFGANHVRVISNTLFVFVDSCWVAVDADGLVFAERVICAGDPGFIEVE